RDLPGMASGAGVVGLDRPDGFDGVVGREEGVQARTERQEVAEARVLLDRGSPGGEVAGGAVAEPAAAQANVQVLGDRELAARGANVVAIPPGIARDDAGIGDAPGLTREALDVAGDAVNVRCEFGGARRAARQVEEAQPLGALPPSIRD